MSDLVAASPGIRSPYLTVVEAAAYIRMSPQMLAVWRMRGGGPEYLFCGTRIRYRVADLDAFMKTRTEGQKRKVSPNVGRPPKIRKGTRKAAR